MTLMKKMFDQFMPASLGFFSLTFIGSLMATSWVLFLKKSHWAKTRISLVKYGLSLAHSKMLETKNSKNKWTHLIFPMFLLCLSFKMLSLIPYTFSQTSHLSITFSLSLPLWLALQILGLMSSWKAKMSHLVPEGTPAYLIPLMVMMELVSLCMQPLTLGFRLGANLLAGHLLMFLCSCVVWQTVSSSPWGSLTFLLLFTLFALEMAVACMQAAVFTMLTKQYLEEKAT